MEFLLWKNVALFFTYFKGTMHWESNFEPFFAQYFQHSGHLGDRVAMVALGLPYGSWYHFNQGITENDVLGG